MSGCDDGSRRLRRPPPSGESSRGAGGCDGVGIKLQVPSNPRIHQASRRKSAKKAQALCEAAGRVSDLRVVALAAVSTASATTPGGSAVAITSFTRLLTPARASLYSSSLASGSKKFASNGVLVYAGSITETRMPRVRSSWSSDSE